MSSSVTIEFLSRHWNSFNSAGLLHNAPKKLTDSDLQYKCHRLWNKVSESRHRALIIGPGVRKCTEIVQRYGLLTLGDEKYDFPPEYDLVNGAVMGAKPWFPLLNDCFILAGIMAHKEFIVPKGEKLTLESLWNSEKNTVTSFGREISLLIKSGYSLQRAGEQNWRWIPGPDIEFRTLFQKQITLDQEITSADFKPLIDK